MSHAKVGRTCALIKPNFLSDSAIAIAPFSRRLILQVRAQVPAWLHAFVQELGDSTKFGPNDRKSCHGRRGVEGKRPLAVGAS